jgi:poly(3-hydroxybutyrate) depolymerase
MACYFQTIVESATKTRPTSGSCSFRSGAGAALAALLPWIALLTGCPVTQSQRTPVDQVARQEPLMGREYWLYVPSDYTPDESWPLVITLHGTPGFDSDSDQIREWKALAEQHKFIVAAPDLDSAQGILPVSWSQRQKSLAADERAILGCLRDVEDHYRIAPDAVLLTGFSAGGYPMYYTGLRNPDRFSGLVARACNSDVRIFELIPMTDRARQMPVIVIHGRDDFGMISEESWAAYRYLRRRGFDKAEHHEILGGHYRHPDIAWKYWSEHLPPQYRR